MLVFSLLLLVAVATCAEEKNQILQVPEPVMDFILGCDRNLRAPKLPISRSSIDPVTGIETEQFGIMDLGSLRDSLHKSFDSESTVNHIVSEIERSMNEQQKTFQTRQACTQVTVDVPEPKLENLSGQLQAVVEQNNKILLQQINTLFTYKINSLLSNIKQLVKNPDVPVAESPVKTRMEESNPASVPVTKAALEVPTEPQEDFSLLQEPLLINPEELLTEDQQLSHIPVGPETVREAGEPLKSEETPEDVPTVPLIRRPGRGQLRRLPSRQPRPADQSEVSPDDGEATPTVPQSRHERIRNMLASRRRRINRRTNEQEE